MVYYAFQSLADWGLFDVILPFILIFTIVFAVLQKAKIFGENSKNFNMVIALVMGLGVVFPHVLGIYPPDRDIVNIINQALPNVSVVLVAIVMFLLIMGVMGSNLKLGKNSMSGIIAAVALVAVAFIFGSAANWWNLPVWLYMLNNPDTMALVIVILVFAIIIWFITKDDTGKDKKDKGEGLGKMFSEVFDNN